MDIMDRLLIIDSDNYVGFEIKKLFFNRFEIFTFTGDITDPFHVEKSVLEINPNYIIHICNQKDLHNKHEKDNLGIKTYQGNLNLISAVRKLQNFKLFFFHSSYDTEVSTHDMAKFSVEKVLAISGIDYCILKLPYVFGDFFRTFIFNIGQHIDDHVKFNTASFDFKLEAIVHEIKNRRTISINDDKSFKFISVDDLTFLYKFLFDNLDIHKKKKYTVPFKSEISIADLVKEIEVKMNGYHIQIEIENNLERKEMVVPTYDILDWQPIFDISQSLTILLQKMSSIEKDIYGL